MYYCNMFYYSILYTSTCLMAIGKAIKCFTDGVGTPDPNPGTFVNWRLRHKLATLAFCL